MVLSGNGGRVSLVQTEVMRLLGAVLPDVVAAVNEAESKVIRVPPAENYYAVRESLEGASLPCIAVGSALGFEDLGNQDQAEVLTMIVYIVDARIEIKDQVDDLWDLAQLAHRVMKQVRGSHCLPDPDGRLLWKYCRAQNITAIPAEWTAYSGLAIHYQVNQAGTQLWPQVTP